MTNQNHATDDSNSKQITRRAALGTGGALLASGLAGCSGLTGGGGDGSSGGSSDSIQLDYWMYFGAQENEEMTSLVEDFNALDNGITVNKQSVPFEEFLTKLFTSVSSGNAPHVASYYGSYGRHLQQICHPIDDYLSNGAKNKYFQSAWDNLQVDGQTYALPLDIHGKGLYTNDAVMEEAGVDPDFADWQSFSDACNTIVEETDSRAFSMLNGQAGQSALRAYIIALTQAGGNIIEGEPGNYDVVFDQGPGKEAAQLMSSVVGEHGWDKTEFRSGLGRINDFVNGDLGMVVEGTWGINNFENENGEVPEDLSFEFHKPFMFPGSGEDVAWAESNSLYFPVNDSHNETEKQAAVEFAEYITQNHTLWASAGGHLPAAKSVATSSEVKNTKLWTEFKSISRMHEMVTNNQIEYQPMTPIHLNSNRYWKPLYEMYLQNMSVDEALTQAANSLQSALDDA
ncbi:extracellular solute-binding protein [Halobaculum magnesiiphilum]|uniref:Extracellular solute-binding protein n=1 Tax=Halobaculum magnesiiphilum TaxID=1017351 RepID=A0A8T8WAQ4_9EURY|nr:extracellular solute-binding protein [Halobaculum magnesiiphilum]QZP36939.1 extracellular solute-binding protein [Halobaculum magnesiiphilum]